MSKKRKTQFKLAPMAAALLLAFGNACAQANAEESALMTPESSVSIGMGSVNSATEARRFSQYTGLNQGAAALLEFELLKRDEATGTWTTFTGRNLGLDTRELGFSRQKQGDWKFGADHNEIVRNDPYIITSSTGTANTDVSLKLQRKAMGLSGEKWITPELQLELNFGDERKAGESLLTQAERGSGTPQQRRRSRGSGGSSGSGSGGWDLLLTHEPIDSASRTIDGRLNFSRGNLALSGGYYGSFYVNNNDSLTASRPDNQAHQLYVSGNYAFSQSTRANFKLSHTHATQNESFVGMGLTPPGTAPDDLGGVVDTALAYFGLSMQPTRQLSVNASMRYEDRADRTPVYVYNDGSGNGLSGTTNWPSGSQTRTTAKVDGTYRFLGAYTVSMGMDWERKVIPVPPANTAVASDQAFFRPELAERGLHSTVRKTMSETLSGGLGFEYKERRGDDNAWVTTGGTTGNPLVAVDPLLTNRVLPTMYLDRDRTKFSGSLDWTPTEDLSLNVVAEHGRDDFLRGYPESSSSQVTPTFPGAQVVTNDALTLDAAYKVSEDWRVNAYWTQSKNRWNVNKVNLVDDSFNKADAVGVSLKGKLTPRMSFGADLLFSRDVTTFTNQPEITYRTSELKFHGNYAIDKKSGVQVTLIHQRFKTDDWQWGYSVVPFVFSDNTTVSQGLNQTATFIGVVYTYRFQ